MLLIVASATMLVLDFRRAAEMDKPTEPPLASVTHSAGDVKRKPEKRMVWFDLHSTDGLFRKDSVRTAKGSTAVIKFQEGGTIEVGENSLIVLEKSKNNQVAIDFVNGNILSKGGGTAGSMVLRSKGMTVDVASAEVELSVDKDKGTASVSVKSGEVKVESQGKSVSIGQNQQSVVSAQGVGEVTEIPFKLSSPDRNALVIVEKDRTQLDFKWENLNAKPQGGSVFEVSPDRDFKALTKSIKADQRTEITQVTLAAGSYYWRVRNESGKLVSEARAIEIQEKIPLRLLEPVSGKVVKFAKAAPQLTFQWAGAPYIERYKVEVASDPEFKTVVRSQEVENASQLSLSLDTPGTLYWRVRGTSSRTTDADLSSPRTLVLNQLAKLQPPEPLAPKTGASFAAKETPVPVQLRWALQEEATGYQVEIARDEKFSEGIETLKTQQPMLEWKAPKLGRVFWRVSSFNLDQELIKAEKSQNFIVVSAAPIAMLEPQPRSVFEYMTEKPKVELKWEKDSLSHSYEIELGRDSAFKGALVKAKADEAAFVARDLEDGVWFWRVRALDSSESPFRTSGMSSFEIKARELLQPPRLSGPAPDLKQVSLTPEDVEIEFSWESVDEAKEYELVIKEAPTDGRAPAGDGRVQRLSATKTTVRKLAAGDYSWSVRTVDRIGRPGKQSAPRRFTVKQEDVLPPPDMAEPEIEQTKK